MIWASFCKKAASPIPPQKGRANQQLEFLATKV